MRPSTIHTSHIHTRSTVLCIDPPTPPFAEYSSQIALNFRGRSSSEETKSQVERQISTCLLRLVVEYRRESTDRSCGSAYCVSVRREVVAGTQRPEKGKRDPRARISDGRDCQIDRAFIRLGVTGDVSARHIVACRMSRRRAERLRTARFCILISHVFPSLFLCTPQICTMERHVSRGAPCRYRTSLVSCARFEIRSVYTCHEIH